MREEGSEKLSWNRSMGGKPARLRMEKARRVKEERKKINKESR